jgi:hypothetical protein
MHCYQLHLQFSGIYFLFNSILRNMFNLNIFIRCCVHRSVYKGVGTREIRYIKGPRFMAMATRRMFYCRNVISHASPLLPALISCTVWGSSPRNITAMQAVSLMYQNETALEGKICRQSFTLKKTCTLRYV